MEHQTIIVTQNNGGRSGGGCGTVFAVFIVVALAIQYWYISAAVVLIALGAGAWYLSRRRATASPLAAPHAAPALATPAGSASVCGNCDAVVRGNFCSECGAAHSLICAHCGQRGLTSPYCPQCGAATYQPPTP